MTIFERINILKTMVVFLQEVLKLKQKQDLVNTGNIEIRQMHTTKCHSQPLYSEKMVVGHIDLGIEAGTINEILNGSRSASYNWYIPKHAKYVVEFVPKERSAWHSGVLHEPDSSLDKLLGGKNGIIESGEPNRYAYGICYEGRTVTTEANQDQIDLAVKLVKEKEIEHLPWVEHWMITSYKPKIVTSFVEGVRELLTK